MSKYDSLGAYLSNQNYDHLPMTFDKIEKIVGTELPASKRYPAWWSNNISNNVMTQQWLDAGYQTESVDTVSEKLVFRRVIQVVAVRDSESGLRKPMKIQTGPRRHPAFGCMNGSVTVAEAVDLTASADPDWAQRADEMTSPK